MNAIEQQREDGPFAAAVPTGLVGVPDVLVVGLATAITLAPTLQLAGLELGATWLWVLAGVGIGIVGRLARPLTRLDWPVPALLRALEYGAVVLLVGASRITYGLLAVVAYRHYDIVYRERTRGDAPGAWLARATGGWESRTVLLAIASAFGHVRPVALVLAVWLATVLSIEAVVSWRRATADRRAPTR